MCLAKKKHPKLWSTEDLRRMMQIMETDTADPVRNQTRAQAHSGFPPSARADGLGSLSCSIRDPRRPQ